MSEVKVTLRIKTVNGTPLTGMWVDHYAEEITLPDVTIKVTEYETIDHRYPDQCVFEHKEILS
jgi:hypothetical protein